MKFSLIHLAVLASFGQHPDIDDSANVQIALKNEELSAEVSEIATALEEIAANARYAADPRKPAADMAAVLAAYFRTPDTAPLVL